MLRHILTVALRTVRTHPVHTIVTGLGLAVALTCTLLLGLYLDHELSYDAFHPTADRVVRITSTDSAAGRTRAKTSALLGPRIENRRPEVEETVRLDRPDEVTVRRGNRTWLKDQLFYADASFFAVFAGFDLRRGDPATALDAPDAAVLSESAAAQYFGDENPVGRQLAVTGVDTFTVTGVMTDPPSTSHFQPHVLVSFDAKGPIERFYDASAWTYALLKPGASVEAFNATMADFVDEKGWEQPGLSAFHAQPLTSIHLRSHLFQEIQPNGSLQAVWILGGAALLILIVACSNFITMSTARATDRAASVGVRKALGAHRDQLIRQFATETLLVMGAATTLSVGATVLLLPAFSGLLDATLSVFALLRSEVLLGGAVVLGLVGVVAAGYPAFVLSRYAPSSVLRRWDAGAAGVSGLQQGLVVFQFAASVLLLLGTVAVHQQTDYLLTADMGFDAERLVTIPMDGPLRQQQDAFVQELGDQPGIAAVSRASGSPLSPRISDYEVEGRTVELHNLLVDRRYVETAGLTVARGRAFDPDRPGDIFQTVLVNRRAAEVLGWDDPVGKTFRRTGRSWPGDKQFKVIGVVDNVHTQSLHDPVKPTVLQVAPPYFSSFVVRAEAGRLSEALASMEETWGQFVPDRVFTRTILSSKIAGLYQQERRLVRLTTAFGAVALVIACLGLYGLAAFVARRRRREVGIRKVLGATTSRVVRRLTLDLLRLVGLGLLVALPLAWMGTHRWLRQFAYAVEVPVGLMGLVCLGTVLVAGLAVGGHALRAARTDPAMTLRDE